MRFPIFNLNSCKSLGEVMNWRRRQQNYANQHNSMNLKRTWFVQYSFLLVDINSDRNLSTKRITDSLINS